MATKQKAVSDEASGKKPVQPQPQQPQQVAEDDDRKDGAVIGGMGCEGDPPQLPTAPSKIPKPIATTKKAESGGDGETKGKDAGSSCNSENTTPRGHCPRLSPPKPIPQHQQQPQQSGPQPKGLESRFKLQMKKYKENVITLSTLQMKVQSEKEHLTAMREQMVTKGMKDPGEIPELGGVEQPAVPALSLTPLHSPRAPSPKKNQTQTLKHLPGTPQGPSVQRLKAKIENLEEERADLLEKLCSLNKLYESQTAYLNKVKDEMPIIEGHYKELAGDVDRAEKYQKSVDDRINSVSKELEHLSAVSNNMMVIKNKYERVQRDFDILKKQLEEERVSSISERQILEEERKQMNEKYSQEHLSRKKIQSSVGEISSEKRELEIKCQELIDEIEELREAQAYNDVKVNEAKETAEKDKEKIAELTARLEEARSKITHMENTIISLNRKGQQMTEQIVKYELDRTCDQNQFSETMHRELVKKEEEIKSLKSQLTEIMERHLRQHRNLLSYQSEPTKDTGAYIEELLKETDANVLKNEILNLHTMYGSLLGEKAGLESALKEKTQRLEELEEENKENSNAIDVQAGLIRVLTDKDEERSVKIRTLLDIIENRSPDDTQRSDRDERYGRRFPMIPESPERDSAAEADNRIPDNVSSSSADVLFQGPGQGNGDADDLEIVSVTSLPEEEEDEGEEEEEDDDEKETKAAEYDRMLAELEEKKAQMSKLERRLNNLEGAHARCARKRIANESRIAVLEVALAFQ